MAVSINNALELIYSRTTQIDRFETIDTLNSNHRVLADDIFATKSLPRFNNSAMDGYTVKLSMAGQTISCDTNILYAGDMQTSNMNNLETIKIMTGAAVPSGCEAIVPFEDVSIDGNNITFPKSIKDGANIRIAGEELKAGSKCMNKGDSINSYAIGLLASQGVAKIKVFAKPTVTILSSGDELVDFTNPNIDEHKLYNSNSPMFYARTTELGCDSKIVNHSDDDLLSLQKQIQNALKQSDIIITSGGASNGDKDLTKEAFLNLGMEMIFDKIDIKPGKPTAVGKIGNATIVILPGNPLAAMVNFELFIVPLIEKLKGLNAFYHSTATTILADDLCLKAGKYSVVLGNEKNGKFYKLDKQSPNMVSELKDATSLLITTPEISYIKASDSVTIVKLYEKIKEYNKNLFYR